eukprot:TRINITY_DN14083_c0_g1_i2.p2 TRINITY_DN14083_c0_g1~~TRINITY_DN14083_c0_g1_i2.p2  ORF type:complete len:129 (-),score=20.18 TRINITY_DN14083_c0_g1_i2:12-398(-)
MCRLVVGCDWGSLLSFAMLERVEDIVVDEDGDEIYPPPLAAPNLRGMFSQTVWCPSDDYFSDIKAASPNVALFADISNDYYWEKDGERLEEAPEMFQNLKAINKRVHAFNRKLPGRYLLEVEEKGGNL